MKNTIHSEELLWWSWSFSSSMPRVTESNQRRSKIIVSKSKFTSNISIFTWIVGCLHPNHSSTPFQGTKNWKQQSTGEKVLKNYLSDENACVCRHLSALWTIAEHVHMPFFQSLVIPISWHFHSVVSVVRCASVKAFLINYGVQPKQNTWAQVHSSSVRIALDGYDRPRNCLPPSTARLLSLHN